MNDLKKSFECTTQTTHTFAVSIHKWCYDFGHADPSLSHLLRIIMRRKDVLLDIVCYPKVNIENTYILERKLFAFITGIISKNSSDRVPFEVSHLLEETERCNCENIEVMEKLLPQSRRFSVAMKQPGTALRNY